MPIEAWPKYIMEKLDGAQNAQFWGLKTWGRGGLGLGLGRALAPRIR